ncbi:MAG: alpha-L-fucosidase [Armatimonadetes bacterium]|nr:alpha-L-fucosidase [Armatimonadota bacterium]
MDHPIRQAAHVTPSARQLAWQELEFTAFVHFGVNTFTDREWGEGTEDPAVFYPTGLDARQWVSVFRDAGMRGVILTAKHHDGFCLWPSRHTDHSVRQSPWKGGQGDVVRELSAACAEAGLKLGLYLSPWDRHEPTYGDSPAYNEHFRNQLRELLTEYGELYCLWFDGACGEGPNGKRQEYDWVSYYELIRELQPQACISICGPDVRWCGNEAGHCRESEWSVVPAYLSCQEVVAGKSQQADDPAFAQRVNTTDQDLGSREQIARARSLIWYPSEVDVSIRPGWFYHAGEDDRVKSLDHLLEIYYGSVGGNAVLLLNVPPDRRGLIHEVDAARLRELGGVLRRTFAHDLARGARASASEADAVHAASCAVDGKAETYWRPHEGTEQAWLELDLGREATFGCACLQECICEGQRVERCALEVRQAGRWRPIAAATTIGYKRLLRFPAVTARSVRLSILESRCRPTIAAFALYQSGD